MQLNSVAVHVVQRTGLAYATPTLPLSSSLSPTITLMGAGRDNINVKYKPLIYGCGNST